jgi:hypothetical protein
MRTRRQKTDSGQTHTDDDPCQNQEDHQPRIEFRLESRGLFLPTSVNDQQQYTLKSAVSPNTPALPASEDQSPVLLSASVQGDAAAGNHTRTKEEGGKEQMQRTAPMGAVRCMVDAGQYGKTEMGIPAL